MNLAEEIRCTCVAPGELAICWLGQAGFLMKDHNGNQVIIDPYLTNCGERLRGFKRLSPVLIQPEKLDPDYYIVTHLHFDHFDYDAIPQFLKRSEKPLFLGPSSCRKELLEIGAEPKDFHLLDRGDVYEDDAVTIRAVLADHGTMAPDAIGIILEMGGQCIYFSGDTAFHPELCQQVAEYHPDIAVLSINGRFGNLNAAEGARAAVLTGSKYAIPCHFWTFAEHGGDPGEFCELLQKSSCAPLCFYQGEIRIVNSKHILICRKETA